MLVLGFSDNLRGPLFFEILKTFNVSDTLGSLIFSGSSICGFASSLFSIRLLNRLSLKQLLSLSLVLFSISLFGISQSHDFWILLLFFGLMGASMGFMGVSQNSLISLTHENIRVRAMSGLHSMYGIASFLAPLTVGLGLSHGWTWPDFFKVAALVPLLLFLSSFFWAREKRGSSVHQKSSVKKEQDKLKFDKPVGLACAVLGFYVIAEILIASRLSLYSIREFSISSSEASRYVTGFFMGLLSGRLLGAFIRWPGKFQSQLMTSLVLSFVFSALGLYGNPWFFILTGLSMSLFYPVCSSFLAEKFSGREGVIFSYATAAQSFLIVVMQLFVGWISDQLGIRQAMHMIFLFLIISFYSLWSLTRVSEKNT